MSESQSVRNFISRGGAGFSFRQKALTPFVLVMGERDLSSIYNKGYSLLLGLQAGVRYDYKTSQFMLRYEIDDAVAGFDLGKKSHCFNGNIIYRLTMQCAQFINVRSMIF